MQQTQVETNKITEHALEAKTTGIAGENLKRLRAYRDGWLHIVEGFGSGRCYALFLSRPHTIWAAEVGDAGTRRDASTRQNNAAFGSANQFRQLENLFTDYELIFLLLRKAETCTDSRNLSKLKRAWPKLGQNPCKGLTPSADHQRWGQKRGK